MKIDLLLIITVRDDIIQAMILLSDFIGNFLSRQCMSTHPSQSTCTFMLKRNIFMFTVKENLLIIGTRGLGGDGRTE